MPSWIVLIRYARLAGVPLEFIVDDEIDLACLKEYLALVNQKRGELNQPFSMDQREVLFWRSS
jgi:hypothetical protein